MDERRHEEEMRPVREAGGGEAEGFEEAEELLIEHAEDPTGDGAPRLERRSEPEEEPNPATYGEADEEKVTEVVRDPDDPRGKDDPGAGPKLTSER